MLFGFAEFIFQTLKMEAICSSETSVVTQRTTRRHIPEDDTLHEYLYSTVIAIFKWMVQHFTPT
jgi:hypothetical protein